MMENLIHMKVFINGNRFKTMIETGSPVTIFELDVIKRTMKLEKLPVRQMIKGNATWSSMENHCNYWDMSFASCR